MCLAVSLFVFLLFPQCEGKSYKNHALLLGVPYNETELMYFKTLKNVYNVTWWIEPTLVFNKVEFSISTRHLADLYRKSKKQNIRFAILIANIQKAFDKQKASNYTRRDMNSYNWHSYYSLKDIYAWLEDVSSNYPDEVQLHSIGITHENRPIMAVRLVLKGSINRSKVIIEGGCHGREWLSPAFVTYMFYALLTSKNNNDRLLQRIAYTYTWIFVPVMNPDGYEFTHTSDRLWRKNRRRGGGVDLNRNYDVAFGVYSSSKDEMDSQYCGNSPFSEPETRAMAAVTQDNRHRLEYYFSCHSFGQYIILPYAYSIKYEDNYAAVKKIVDRATEQTQIKHHLAYRTGTSYETAGYLASGVSTDWVKKSFETPFVMTLELPDTGAFGFALPPNRILGSCQATLDMLLEILSPQGSKFLRKNIAGGVQNNQVCVEVVLLCMLVCKMSCRVQIFV